MLHHLLLLLDLLTLVEAVLVLLFVHVEGVVVVIHVLSHLWATKLIILKPVLRARHDIPIASVVVLTILIASNRNKFRLFRLLVLLLLLEWYRRWWLLLLLEILLLLQLMLLQVICLIIHRVLFDTLVLLWVSVVELLLLSLLGHLWWAWLRKLAKSYAVVVVIRIIEDVHLAVSLSTEVRKRVA